MINHVLADKIYSDIKKYLQSNSRFSPIVINSNNGKSVFPKVVISETRNNLKSRDMQGFESHSSIGIEINIFAEQKTIDSKVFSGKTIARELSSLCDHVCDVAYGMKRTGFDETPNIDSRVFRLTLNYSATQNDMRSVFF